jgi:hypothetical protein
MSLLNDSGSQTLKRLLIGREKIPHLSIAGA